MYIVVPAFNERDNIPLLLDDLRARTAGLDARLVVVDDGSTDGTADEVERRATGMAMQLVRHPVNQGLGAAVRSGFAAVLGEADDDAPVVTIEADTTSDLDDLPVMLERLRAGA